MAASFKEVKLEQILFLHEIGFKFIDTKSQYEEQRLTDGTITIILYKSGKLLIQGKDLFVDKIKELFLKKGLILNENKKTEFKSKDLSDFDWNLESHIGSDETLKGDTFGGLVVVAFYYKPEQKEKLEQLGIRDSKKISDEKIKYLAKILKNEFTNQFAIKNLNPKDYNKEIKSKNITTILNYWHENLAQELMKEKKILHIVDKYPGCQVGDVQIPRAETYSLAVAAASILARAEALEQIKILSEKVGFKIPMGSTHVIEALAQLKKQKEPFENYVKLHFRNVKEFLG